MMSCDFYTCKNENFHMKYGDIFLIFVQKQVVGTR